MSLQSFGHYENLENLCEYNEHLIFLLFRICLKQFTTGSLVRSVIICLTLKVNINKPGLKTLLKISNALNLPLKKLFNFKEV